VKGRFTARYGPDNRYIASFALKVQRSEDIPKMLDQGISRLDNIYASALSRGVLKTDKSLIIEDPFNLDELNLEDFELDDVPAVGSIEGDASASTAANGTSVSGSEAAITGSAAATSISLQFDTPDVGAVSSGESAVRSIPGVTSASTSSLALGGVSVMSVTYRGDITALAQALRAQGWQVQQGAGALRISRSGQ
jgi:hypothetical protein